MIRRSCTSLLGCLFSPLLLADETALVHKQQLARDLSDAMDADLARAQALIEPGKPLSVFYLDSEVNGLDSEGQRGFVSTLLGGAGGAGKSHD